MYVLFNVLKCFNLLNLSVKETVICKDSLKERLYGLSAISPGHTCLAQVLFQEEIIFRKFLKKKKDILHLTIFSPKGLLHC